MTSEISISGETTAASSCPSCPSEYAASSKSNIGEIAAALTFRTAPPKEWAAIVQR